MLHIQTYHNSNFPLLKYASNVPCFMQVCASLNGQKIGDFDEKNDDFEMQIDPFFMRN